MGSTCSIELRVIIWYGVAATDRQTPETTKQVPIAKEGMQKSIYSLILNATVVQFTTKRRNKLAKHYTEDLNVPRDGILLI